jgi:5-methylcytosine-specific restriction endonuclease McrA
MKKNESILEVRKLTSPELLKQTEALVREEREIGIAILHRLREISRRRLHCQAGFSSLFTYCVQQLKYPEANAYRLIQAMRAVEDFPEIETKIQEGELSISAVSQVQSFCNSQQKENVVTVTPEQKKKLFAAVEGKTRKESDQALASLFPQNPLPKKKDKENPLNATETQITFVANTELMAKLKQIRELLVGGAFLAYPELFSKMAELSLKRLDPVKRSNTVPAADSSPQPQQVTPEATKEPLKTTPSRYIPAAVRRAAWTRAGGQCCFVSKTTGKRCTERANLEFEHKKPFALGGDNSIENIEISCRGHNLYAAIVSFEYMDAYLRN